jgi:hypothetical protein
MILAGRTFDLLYVIIVVVAFLLILYSKNWGYQPSIRRLPSVDAFEEAIGRAAEMGRPAFYTTWMSDISNISRYNPIMAGLSCLGYAARLCARYNVPLYTIYNFPEIEPLQDSILRQAYSAEGKTEAYDPTEQLIYTPQWSNVIATINILQNKRVGASFYIGYSFYAQQVYPEMGIRVGAFQIGGTDRYGYYLVMGCDYAMFGEEIYAAGALLSGDETMMRTVVASDWLKMITIAIMIIGIILLAGGSTAIADFLGS